MKKITPKVLKQRIFNVISSILLAGIIIVGTVYVWMYAYGYRFSLEGQTFERTGVLSVESNPTWADIFLNDENKGKTSKTIGSVVEGTYNVKVQKENYQTWQKVLPIKAELSTPTLAFLFLANPVKSEAQTINKNVTNTTVSQNQDHYFITTTEDTQPIPATTKTPAVAQKIVTVYDYKINKNFWDFGDNLKSVFTITLPKTDTITIVPSENGELAYLIDKIDEKALDRKIYLIKTATTQLIPEEINLKAYNKYTLNWANDNRHIILESDSEILSYDVTTKATVVLLRKVTTDTNNIAEISWKTDKAGNFYYIDYVQQSPEYYQIKQKQLDGTNEKVVLDEIYWQKDKKFLDKENSIAGPFTNSPQSTRFTGQIKDFYPNPEQKGIVIITEYALYWYDTKLQKYFLVNPDLSAFGQYSIDNTKFTYFDTTKNSLNVFTFQVNEIDHISRIGSKTVLPSITDIYINSFKWTQNSMYISYMKNNDLMVIDADGENQFKLMTLEDPESSKATYVIDYQVQNVFLMETDQDKSTIEKYQVH